MTILGNTYSIKEKKKEAQYGGIDTILTFIAIYFHVLKKAYNFCKYKTQCSSKDFCYSSSPKNALIVELINPTFFFSCQL